MNMLLEKQHSGVLQQGRIFIHNIQEITDTPHPLYIVSANMRHHIPLALQNRPHCDTSLATLQITQPQAQQKALMLMEALAHFSLVQAEITVQNLVLLSNPQDHMPHCVGELVAVHHFMAHRPWTE
jgi:hypothetical protein